MNEDKYSSVGWHSVVFSVAESPVDIEKEEWKSKHNVEKLNFEIELEQPTVLGGIKIGRYFLPHKVYSSISLRI